MHSPMIQTSLMEPMGMQSLKEILPHMQQNVDLWHKHLLQVSGGQLSSTKYSWMPFKWTMDLNSMAQLTDISESIQLHMTDQSGQQHALKTNEHSKAVWLLGVHIVANGNYNKELKQLKQKQSKYTQFLILCHATKHEPSTINATFQHSFPARTIPPSHTWDAEACNVLIPQLLRIFPYNARECCLHTWIGWRSGSTTPQHQAGHPTSISSY